MLWKLLTDAVVLLHLGFVVFAVLGGFLAWRSPRIAFVHLPVLCWAVWIELSGRICPLTPLENRLRELAGEAGYSGGFVEHYALPVLYPLGLTRHIQWLLALALLLGNGIAYGLLIAGRRARPQ